MRPDETAVPPAVGSLALSPSLQGLFLCRFLYPLLRVSSSCLCPVSLSRLSRPVSLVPSLSSRFLFSLFLRVSVSPCPAPLFRSLRVSLISPLPASLSAFYLLRLLPYSIFFLSSSLCAPLCSLPFFIPASSPHLSSSRLSSSLLLLLLPLSSLSEMPVETVFEKSRISLPAASCGVCFVFDANVVNFPLL